MFVPVTSVITRMGGDRQSQKVAYINAQVRDDPPPSSWSRAWW